ncbi:hypothetical protein BDR26DRAFT_979030 [Obelidium mucronatum]|nr:hypothetical protein BDR26DRAFT_979030 [Obelidium mucronatum]
MLSTTFNVHATSIQPLAQNTNTAAENSNRSATSAPTSSTGEAAPRCYQAHCPSTSDLLAVCSKCKAYCHESICAEEDKSSVVCLQCKWGAEWGGLHRNNVVLRVRTVKRKSSTDCPAEYANVLLGKFQDRQLAAMWALSDWTVPSEVRKGSLDTKVRWMVFTLGEFFKTEFFFDVEFGLYSWTSEVLPSMSRHVCADGSIADHSEDQFALSYILEQNCNVEGKGEVVHFLVENGPVGCENAKKRKGRRQKPPTNTANTTTIQLGEDVVDPAENNPKEYCKLHSDIMSYGVKETSIDDFRNQETVAAEDQAVCPALFKFHHQRLIKKQIGEFLCDGKLPFQLSLDELDPEDAFWILSRACDFRKLSTMLPDLLNVNPVELSNQPLRDHEIQILHSLEPANEPSNEEPTVNPVFKHLGSSIRKFAFATNQYSIQLDTLIEPTAACEFESVRDLIDGWCKPTAAQMRSHVLWRGYDHVAKSIIPIPVGAVPLVLRGLKRAPLKLGNNAPPPLFVKASYSVWKTTYEFLMLQTFNDPIKNWNNLIQIYGNKISVNAVKLKRKLFLAKLKQSPKANVFVRARLQKLFEKCILEEGFKGTTVSKLTILTFPRWRKDLDCENEFQEEGSTVLVIDGVAFVECQNGAVFEKLTIDGMEAKIQITAGNDPHVTLNTPPNYACFDMKNAYLLQQERLGTGLSTLEPPSARPSVKGTLSQASTGSNTCSIRSILEMEAPEYLSAVAEKLDVRIIWKLGSIGVSFEGALWAHFDQDHLEIEGTQVQRRVFDLS